MGIIKFWYYLYLAYFGKMSEELVEKLMGSVPADIDFNYWPRHEPREAKVVEMYFRHIRPSEVGLRKISSITWVRVIYLENLGRRNLLLADYEHDAILGLMSGSLGHLSRQLDSTYEIKLLQKRDEEAIFAYIQNHPLSLVAERDLLRRAAGQVNKKCDFRFLAKEYIKIHPDKAFRRFDAQQLLFELPFCGEIQHALVEQSSMDNPVLHDSVIEQMLDEAAAKKNYPSTEVLRHFLSRSFIKNPALKEKMLKMKFDSALTAQIRISNSREKLFNFGYWPEEGTEEMEIISMPSGRQRDEKVYLIMTEEGQLSPEMAAWIAWQYPDWADDVATKFCGFAEGVVEKLNYSMEMDRFCSQHWLY